MEERDKWIDPNDVLLHIEMDKSEWTILGNITIENEERIKKWKKKTCTNDDDDNDNDGREK